VLLLIVYGIICDCDGYDGIAEWGRHITFLRHYMPYHHGVPGGRWLPPLMNRIDPILFSRCFTAWERVARQVEQDHRRPGASGTVGGK